MAKIIELVQCRGSTAVAAFIPFTVMPQSCKGKTIALVELDNEEVSASILPEAFKLEFATVPTNITTEEGEDHGH